MSGISDLDELLHSMRPEARPGEYVVVTVAGDLDIPFEALIREEEGTTLVLKRDDADAAGIPYDFVAAWITLTVHSDLAAVGLTAAISTALANEGISCNVLAGFHHDHLLVPAERLDDALAALATLSEL
ncbi:MAG: ACT domain-containing protein [Pseudolysinimonas sp.]|uniref:ACT domain-containing protein n=1 Tax=Pseudolysinimonas sp. TaxID=2680009 RepID=UPI003264A851